MKNISILGAGNGGHAMAADLSVRGYKVTLYELPEFSSKFRKVLESKEIDVRGYIDEKVKIYNATTDIEEAVSGAELIYVVMPSFGHKKIAYLLAPHVNETQDVVLMTGNAGSIEVRYIFKELGKDVTVAETSTLPYGCRMHASGQVDINIMTDEVHLAALPASRTERVLEKVIQTYPTISASTNVLETALDNPNPLIHTTGVLLNLGRIEYSEGEFYMYNEGITPSVVQVIKKKETERQKIAAAFDLELIRFEDFASRYTDYKRKNEKVHFLEAGEHGDMKGPQSRHDRYITEDVPYGLVLWSSFADLAGVETPLIDSEIYIASVVNCKNYMKNGRNRKNLGIEHMSKDEILEFLNNDVTKALNYLSSKK